MEEFVARENIRRFEAQLSVCADENQKAILTKLLEQERQRLQDIRSGAIMRPQDSAPS